jgi:hypothetical protein
MIGLSILCPAKTYPRLVQESQSLCPVKTYPRLVGFEVKHCWIYEDFKATYEIKVSEFNSEKFPGSSAFLSSLNSRP